MPVSKCAAIPNKLAKALLISFICLFVSACTAARGPSASPLNAEAQQQAEAFWNSQLTKCGDSFYRKLQLKDGGIQYYEYKEPSVRLAPQQVTEADRLNGIEWQGLIFLQTKASRVWGTALGHWEQWADGTGRTGDNSYPMKKVNGRWSVDTNRGGVFEETSKYVPVDCSKIPQ